jgi:hypothetical protein
VVVVVQVVLGFIGTSIAPLLLSFTITVVNVNVIDEVLDPHVFLAITFQEYVVPFNNVDGLYELVVTFDVGLPGNVVPTYTS